MVGDSFGGPGRGRLAQEISESLSELVKLGLGRGPVRAQTYIHEQAVCCLFYGTMTQVETMLVRNGNHDVADQVRDRLHGAIRGEAIRRVEAATGRKVRAYLSDHQAGPDCGTLVFVLEPERSQPERARRPAP